LLNYKYIFLFLVILKAASYWLISWWQHPTDPLSTIIIYRVGDIQYFPLIQALSRFQFGDFCLYEFRGTGVLSFPFIAFIPHALSYRLFGPFGFILADISVALAYYLILSRLFELLKVSSFLSRITSLLITCGVINLCLSVLSKFLVNKDFGFFGPWGWRIPRPFVTEVFFLMCIYYILALSDTGNLPRRRYWLMLGLSLALLLQGDLHSAIVIASGISCFVLFLLLSKKNLTSYIIKGILWCFSSFAVFAIPFFLQRALEHPDVPRRFGVFPIDRMRLLLLSGKSTYAALGVIVVLALTILLLLKHSRNVVHREHIKVSVIALMLIYLGAFIAQPASVILSGKGIQLSQFYDRFIITTLLILTIFALYLIYFIDNYFKHNPDKLKAALSAGYNVMKKFIIIMSVLLCLSVTIRQAYVLSKKNQHFRSDFPEYASLKNYRYDFVSLVKELSMEEYKDYKVLGTFDIQLFSWWVTFHHGYSYTIDPCATAVPTSQMESRLINLCKIIGMGKDDFMEFLNRKFVWVFWVNAAQYQASSFYTFSPLSDYDKDEQKIIRGSNSTWYLVMPNSEKTRFLNRFLFEGVNKARLDLVVLTNDDSLKAFSPASEKFMLSYENPTFRVWRKKD
jgi:hypothetical protein